MAYFISFSAYSEKKDQVRPHWFLPTTLLQWGRPPLKISLG